MTALDRQISPAPETLAERVYRNRHFYFFISPFFISFAILGFYPLLFSLYLAFFKWDGLTDKAFVGLGNFRTLWADTTFWDAIRNTALLGFLYVPPMLFLAFLLAVALNGPITRLRGFFRAAVFLPCVTPVVVISIVFIIFTSRDAGLFNWLLTKLQITPVQWESWPRAEAIVNWILTPVFRIAAHIGPVDWRGSPLATRITIAILLIWRWTGYNMIFMLAGLQGISGDVYEAARIDGANRWQTLTRVTLPLMSSTFVFCTIMSLLGTVYMFEEVLLVDLNGSARNLGVLLFQNSFSSFKFGYASAMAYVVAAIVFTLTMIVRRVQKEEA
jgi:cellobiose transport system permease protein